MTDPSANSKIRLALGIQWEDFIVAIVISCFLYNRPIIIRLDRLLTRLCYNTINIIFLFISLSVSKELYFNNILVA